MKMSMANANANNTTSVQPSTATPPMWHSTTVNRGSSRRCDSNPRYVSFFSFLYYTNVFYNVILTRVTITTTTCDCDKGDEGGTRVANTITGTAPHNGED